MRIIYASFILFTNDTSHDAFFLTRLKYKSFKNNEPYYNLFLDSFIVIIEYIPILVFLVSLIHSQNKFLQKSAKELEQDIINEFEHISALGSRETYNNFKRPLSSSISEKQMAQSSSEFQSNFLRIANENS
jgi:hypothetical protein